VAGKDFINFPDVLGYITGSERQQVGVLQVALATRPAKVQAGLPFEVIVLVQSTVDCVVDLAVGVKLPGKDAKGQKKCFVATSKKDRLGVRLEPAETGIMRWPVACAAKTAPGEEYLATIDIDFKPADKKATVIRLPEGGGRFNPERVPPKAQKILGILRQLKFSTQKKSGLFSGGGLELPFTVVKGKGSKDPKSGPSWVDLWTLAGQSDAEPLLSKYGDVFRTKVLPGLRRVRVYEPLLEKTTEMFEKAGYPLTDIEVSAVARLLTAILEFGGSTDLATKGGEAAALYNVQSLVMSKRLPGEDEERPVPYWARTILQAMAKDERVIKAPHKAVMAIAFDDLLHDALLYGLQVVARESSVDMGDDEEMEAYAQMIMGHLATEDEMNFGYVFLPLVLAGAFVFDLVLLKDEMPKVAMKDFVTMLEKRQDEMTSANEAIFDIAQNILDKLIMRFGLMDSAK
jgi:hypothetical protein